MTASTGLSCSPPTVRWLRELVGHATVSGQSNLALAQTAAESLESSGFAIRWTRSEDGQRANLFASLGSGDRGLLLAGHTDVVPVSGQSWQRPPFELTEDQHHFYGRGTCDMKGFLAVLLSAAERLVPARMDQPLHIALTYDEEVGCLGVRGLLADLAQAGISPAACIVGEPTGMRVVRSHKGRHAYRCRIRGRAAHSSLAGLGVNAAEAACALVASVSCHARSLASVERDEGFNVPHSTMATCRIQAGQAANVIPEEAEFDFDLRYLPATDPEAVMGPIRDSAAALQRDLRELVADSEVQLVRRTAVPALASAPRADAIADRALRAGAHFSPHVDYTTEGGLYHAAGIPTIICGPGDIAQAHTADEYILKSELAACEQFVHRLLGLAA